jgi:uncharacterized repeat protein (TIGR03803 family)
MRVMLIKSVLTLAIVACTLELVQPAQAQTYTLLYKFSGGDGEQPYGRLIPGSTPGTFYGTTLGGGLNFAGVVYLVTTGGQEAVLHSFATPSADGRSPQAGLIRDSYGNLYGTTQYGGAYSYGTVFMITGTGQEKVVLNFDRYNGQQPISDLTRDGYGNLYGTTKEGGDYGYGAVFKLASNGSLTVLHNFNIGPQDGQYPYGGLVRDASGNLYGTTISGGTYNEGVVFKLSATGARKPSCTISVH